MAPRFKPGTDSSYFFRLPAAERAEIAAETDRIFAERTGVSRPLSRTSRADEELRQTWLRIRDSVMLDREIEQQMDMQRQDFIEDLPGIVASDMRSHGWTTAARLMETWMTRPVAEMPRYSEPVADIVKMDWVLGFHCARKVHDGMIKDRIWANDASRMQLAKRLFKAPVAAGGRFGALWKPAAEVDRNWINARSCNAYRDDMAIMAALGRFSFNMAVSGKVRQMTYAGAVIEIDEVGIYVKDSYDFNGPQFLGYWGHRDSPVNNSDFREWRTLSNAGGDFLVYSDVKRTKLNPPGVVEITAAHAAAVHLSNLAEYVH